MILTTKKFFKDKKMNSSNVELKSPTYRNKANLYNKIIKKLYSKNYKINNLIISKKK